MVEYVVQSRDAVRVVVADEGVPVGYVCTVIECGNGGFAVAGCEHAGWNQYEQRHGEGHYEGVSFHWLPLECEIRRLSPIVNSTAESRRHAAAVKIGSVDDLEYAAKSWFGLPAAKSHQIFAKESFS